MSTLRWALPVASVWAATLDPCAAQSLLPVKPLPASERLVQAADGEGLKIEPGAQVRPVQLELRGNVIIGGGGGGLVISGLGLGSTGQTEEPDPAGGHVLEFANGHQFHGTLEALDIAGGRVTWRRPDVATPLALPLEQVRRLTLAEKSKPEATPLATIKLTGSDWLNAEVTAIEGDKIHLKFPDGTNAITDRAHVEWIYFSKRGSVECYDGPTSLAGWSSSGGWSYRDGALRALSPTPIQRQFGALPDRVEYRMTVDQGKLSSAFTLMLNKSAEGRLSSRRMLQLMVRAKSMSLWGPVAGDYKSQQVDVPAASGLPSGFGRGPVQLRLLEDFIAGRIVVFIDGKRRAEWKIDPGEAGQNGGGFQFQSNSWSGQEEQSISKIQVLPWDGREPSDEEEAPGDRVSLANGQTLTGQLRSVDERTVTLRDVGAPREQVTFLRLARPKNVPDEEPSVAKVRLARGGELEVAAVNWRDGKFVFRTNFAGELSVASRDLIEVEFRRDPAPAARQSDVLVFKNGDRLHGSLRAATAAGQLRWRANPADEPVEFSPSLLAGIQFAAEVPGLPGNVTARFRNGDSWTAGFVTLDRESLVLDTAEAGQLTLPRAALKSLYFNPDNRLAVSEATADHELWERGLDLSVTGSMRKRAADTASPWRYFAGSYSLASNAAGGAVVRSNANLGRLFETMPARAEIAFTVSSPRSSIYFSAQLFAEPGNPGYMVHLSSMGLSLYDMNPKSRARGIFQQQFQFGKEIAPDARQRQVRFLADRGTGRLVIVVDGVVVGQVNPKTADGPRNLGRGVMIVPQANVPCRFSDIWVGPWNGQIPKKTGGPDNAQETIVLTNGDEAQGTVEMATPTSLKLASELGPLELPVERVTMADFGGAPIERPPATRLQLNGLGSLSVKQWRVEEGTMILQSTIAGELRLPLNRVQEIVFATAESLPAKNTTPP